MASGANWRNLQQTHTNATGKGEAKDENQTSKDKKHQNLESNLFGSDDQERPTYNPNLDKAAFGSDANWSAQGTSAKIINKGYKQDPYRKKQQ